MIFIVNSEFRNCLDRCGMEERNHCYSLFKTFQVFEITLSRGYSENHFRDDLKILYNKLGIENKKVVFLFTDQHVVEEGQWQEIHRLYLNVFHSTF